MSGRWRLTATNPIGSAEVGLHFHVRSDPDPPREAPEVEEISPEGIVTLSWLANVEDEEIYGDIQYQVEYNRETWDIWLKVRIILEYPKKGPFWKRERECAS